MKSAHEMKRIFLLSDILEGKSSKSLRPIFHVTVSILLNGHFRCNPVSMYRPELSKGNLARLLSEERYVRYSHVPQLGVPRDIFRAKAIETGTREVIWNWYDETVIGSFFQGNLHYFLGRI